MDLDELKIRQDMLEELILHAINSFEQHTGVAVNGINQYRATMSDGKIYTVSIKAKLEL